MTEELRVLVVDDSPTARALIIDVLESDPALRVVGEASNGLEAIAAARRLQPSVITMDMFMPVMDGLEATREIMVETPTPIVMVSSAANSAEVNLSFEATSAGALTVIGKPEAPGSADFAQRSREFAALIRTMAQVKVVRRYTRLMTPPDPLLSSEALPPSRPARVVAIAASTGGPAVLHDILHSLPGDFPLPVLVVQHIARGFVKALAGWLDRPGGVRVKIASDGERLRGGTAYLAPDDMHLGLRERGIAQISAASTIAGFRPSATYLFQAVARVYGSRSAAVILTGMGSDGVAGLRAVREAGGQVIAQSERTCVVYGMPQEAIRCGLVDAILSPRRIAEHLASLRYEGSNVR